MKQVIRINEDELNALVLESVMSVLDENFLTNAFTTARRLTSNNDTLTKSGKNFVTAAHLAKDNDDYLDDIMNGVRKNVRLRGKKRRKI